MSRKENQMGYHKKESAEYQGRVGFRCKTCPYRFQLFFRRSEDNTRGASAIVRICFQPPANWKLRLASSPS
jgi:hypothetical protein